MQANTLVSVLLICTIVFQIIETSFIFIKQNRVCSKI